MSRLPHISANLPKGTCKIAVDRKYEVSTQLSSTLCNPDSRPICGNAGFKDEPINGTNADDKQAINSIQFLYDFDDKSIDR